MGVVLRGSMFMKPDDNSRTLNHPAAADVAKYCREEIEKCGSMFAELPICAHLCQFIGFVVIKKS